MLYTFPLIAVQASSFVLCAFSIEGVTRWRVSTPRRSEPDDAFSAAQSSGPNPGASATFSRYFLEGGLLVLGGRPSVAPKPEEEEEDTVRNPRPLLLLLLLAEEGCTPGTRTALPGRGGGGISWASVSTFGRARAFDLGVVDADPNRCALDKEGNAGGVSVSSDLASSSSSSSCWSRASGGETLRVTSDLDSARPPPPSAPVPYNQDLK